jgi:hypothetical protein
LSEASACSVLARNSALVAGAAEGAGAGDAGAAAEGGGAFGTASLTASEREGALDVSGASRHGGTSASQPAAAVALIAASVHFDRGVMREGTHLSTPAFKSHKNAANCHANTTQRIESEPASKPVTG